MLSAAESQNQRIYTARPYCKELSEVFFLLLLPSRRVVKISLIFIGLKKLLVGLDKHGVLCNRLTACIVTQTMLFCFEICAMCGLCFSTYFTDQITICLISFL